MAALTTTRDGTWSNATTGVTPWTALTGSGAGGVPGAGDTVTIGHAVAVGSNATVGGSGATGTAAVTIARPGVLTVAGATLTLRGDIVGPGYNAGIITVNLLLGGGGGLEFDPPTGARYKVDLKDDCAWETSGTTSASRAFIRTKSGAAGSNAHVYASGARTGLASASHCDFTRLGDSSQQSFANISVTDQSNTYFILNDCTFTTCGEVDLTCNQGGAVVSLTDCRWTGSTGSWSIFPSFSNALTTGTRLFRRCSFDGPVLLASTSETFDECYFGNSLVQLDSGFAWAAFTGGMIVASGNANLSGDVTDLYSINVESSNPHGPGVLGFGRSYAVVGAIFEAPNATDATGDLLTTKDNSSGATLNVTRCLVLPTAANGTAPGKFISCLGTGNYSVTAEHNTVATSANMGEQGVIGTGETGGGNFANLVASLKSNIAWSATAGNGTIYHYQATATPVADILPAANADYNDCWNCGPGNRPIGAPVRGYYDSNAGEMFSTGSPDAHGIAANPSFVDPGRNLMTWARTFHATDGTLAAALAVVAADPSTIAALRAWVRAGYAPTNPALATAAHDGTTIGAVASAAAGRFSRAGLVGGMSDLTGGTG